MSDTWTEHQMIAAARGLPIPPADQPPPEELIVRPLPSESPAESSQNLANLTVPLGPRSLSTASDSGSNAGSALPSPTTAGPARGTSSPFKPRAKALAAALVSSRNGSTTEIVPREINLPNDPFVNGQPLEVYLYKEASECPICFLYYPPYLNHTRCCDQPICSECFVQIKRADPHYPEGHGDNNHDNPNVNPEEQAGMLISEPACCPYCQQPEFGVTYDAPPFRRGLSYSLNSSLGLAASATAMSSSSSLNSTLTPASLASPAAGAASAASRRRTQSLSANAPNVITTDRVRPDWSTKLATQRAHIARRAAAATALHTAAFLMGNTDNRPFRVGRFSRRNTAGSATNNEGGEHNLGQGAGDGGEGANAMEPGAAHGSSGRVLLASNNRRSRMEDLEELMFREALRQSLATEEERKRKSEKEERKEAKRREKEERKAAKKQGSSSSGPYGAGGQTSTSGSSLSLSGLGLGRRRGNSAASNLRVEASVANAMASGTPSGSTSPVNTTMDKGKAVDRGTDGAAAADSHQGGNGGGGGASSAAPAGASPPRPIPSPHPPVGPSHLRQMSSASSVSSSLADSTPGSYPNPSHLDPRSSGLSLGSRSAASEDGGEHADERDPSASTEPMFNFSSLAEMVGVQLEGENAGRRLSVIGREGSAAQEGAAEPAAAAVPAEDGGSTARNQDDQPHTDESEDTSLVEQSVGTLRPTDTSGRADGPPPKSTPGTITTTSLAPPEVMITPETPAAIDDDGDDSKRLGFGTSTVEHTNEVTQ